MSSGFKELKNELILIKKELRFIRSSLPDPDIYLTTEEKKLVEQSYHNERDGKLISGTQLKKRLGLV